MNSTVTAKMGKAWPNIQMHVDQFMSGIGPEGVPLVDFETECLASVFIPDRPSVLAALKRKKLLFPVRDGLAVRVFRENPEDRRFEDKSPHTAGYEFARSALALMIALTAVVEANDMPDAERRAREREAVRWIGLLARRHIAKGTSVPAMRGAMWAAYKPAAMAVLARLEAVFDPAGEVEEVVLKEPTKRLPNGLTHHMRIVEMIRRAGPPGMVKTELQRRFPSPRPKADEIDAILSDIEGAELVVSAMVRLRESGRPGRRYFHSDYGLPPVVDGIMRPRPIKHYLSDEVNDE